MPLYIDDEQIAPRNFALMYGMKQEAYDRLMKKPIFKLDASQVSKKTTITANRNLSEPPTQGIKCSFWFKGADGMTRKFVYAESRSPDPKSPVGTRTWLYKPGYLFPKGTVVNVLKNREDEAIFWYFYPGNPMSPFASKTKLFSFVDPVAQTLQAAADMSDIQKALTHATTADEEELVILAKGLKLLTSDDYETAELRVKMQQFAIAPTTNRVYTKAMTDEITLVEGRIRNCVDKGIMRLAQTPGGNGRQWIWGTGAKEGAPIGEPIMNVNEDAVSRLITAIKTNFDAYAYDLRTTTVQVKADRKLKESLEKHKIEVPAHLAEINADDVAPQGPSLKDEVYDVKSAQDFVSARGYKKTAPEIKQFREAVNEERVNYKNVDLFLASLYNK
jgi:hypothetical protein